MILPTSSSASLSANSATPRFDHIILPGAPREFRTALSLSEPGTQASFKVYVVLTTGNEAGSNAVTVTRPE